MPSHTPPSDYDRLIPAEVKDDAFYQAILTISRNEKLQNVLEIGSSSGEGSTEAFVLGLRENPNKPTLFCMEVSSPRFEALRARYAGDSLIRPYRVSSVPAEKFPSEGEVTRFYNAHLAGRFFPLEEVLRWLRQDVEYIRSSGVPTEGVKLIKQENGIDFFDLVLIDGSEFAGVAELDEVYGAGFILLDDINTFKNFANFQRLINDPAYVLTDLRPDVRNGFAIFKRKDVSPRSYSTIQAAVERIEGFMVAGQEQYLFDKVASLPDNAVILEIGSFKGRSTVAMAFACVGTARRLYCADTWDGNDKDFPERNFFDIWKQNVDKNGVEKLIQPVPGTSHDVLDNWHSLTGGQLLDFVFIDGSHEYGDVLKDLQLVWPFVKDLGWVAFHDVHHTWPGPLEVWTDVGMRSLVKHEYSTTLACGQKPPGGVLAAPRDRAAALSGKRLPVHFFTIVLNGLPYLRHHIDQFRQLGFDWHWHVVEGVADLKHDTAWSVAAGGKIPPAFHSGGRSVDGTGEYLDQLVKAHPDRVTVYRKPPGQHWDGKLEMVSAPLNAIAEDCLLWEIDADELWTAEQFTAGRQLFLQHPTKTAAMYWCWFFVGPDLVISTRNCYANNPQGEWLRTWRYSPGMRWFAHEPPTLGEQLPDGQWRSVAQVDPLLHGQTEAAGLVFQHYAYATENQVRFKQDYYGYRGSVERWHALQAADNFPVALRNYFPWVQDHTQVDRAAKYVTRKLIDLPARSPVPAPTVTLRQPGSEPKIVIDGVFFQMYQTGIARVWSSLLQTWAADGFARNLVVLDRGNSAPKFPGVRYRAMDRYDYSRTEHDRRMVQTICDEEAASVFISTYYTTPLTTPSVFMAYDMIPELFGWDLMHPMWREKHAGIRHASAFASISHQTKVDLMRYFPHIASERIFVTPLACAPDLRPRPKSEIDALRQATGTIKPYFLTVGARGGYKNTELSFKALGRFERLDEFDIFCAGHGPLEPEFQQYIGAKQVKAFKLTDDALAAAYSGAVALLHPSTYEGFGLPVLEAMSCGCPVITTRCGSLAEVAGDAALFVNEHDAEGMLAALNEVQKPEVRERLIAAGLKQAAKFSWQRTADEVREVLLRVARPAPGPAKNFPFVSWECNGLSVRVAG